MKSRRGLKGLVIAAVVGCMMYADYSHGGHARVVSEGFFCRIPGVDGAGNLRWNTHYSEPADSSYATLERNGRVQIICRGDVHVHSPAGDVRNIFRYFGVFDQNPPGIPNVDGPYFYTEITSALINAGGVNSRLAVTYNVNHHQIDP